MHQIYGYLLIAQCNEDQQIDYDTMHLAMDTRDWTRNLMDEFCGRTTICPGLEFDDDRGSYQLDSARGLVFANKQLNAQVTSAFFATNTFLICISETFRYETPGQIFACKLLPASIAAIQHLIIVVRHVVPINARVFDRATDTIKHNMMHVVKSLNASKNNLKTLKIRPISRCSGRLERVRPEVDALLKDVNCAPVEVLLTYDRSLDRLKHADRKRFMISAYNVTGALMALQCRVGRFQIVGDVPGFVVERLNRKFSNELHGHIVDETKLASDHTMTTTSPATVPAHVPATPSSTSTPTTQAEIEPDTESVLTRDYEIGGAATISVLRMVETSANRPWVTDLDIWRWYMGPGFMRAIRELSAGREVTAVASSTDRNDDDEDR